MERWISKQKRFEGRIFSVVEGAARLDDDTVVSREMVEHHGGVAVVPVAGDDVVLIRQFRIAINKTILEIPAGRLEGDEPPAARARAELAEEVGYRAGKLELAHTYYSTAGFTNERMYLYLAFDLTETAVNPEFDERIEIVKLPITAVAAKLASGEIEDAKTIIGLRALLAYLDKRQNVDSTEKRLLDIKNSVSVVE